MAIVAVIMSVNFAACSDDDEEESTPTTENIVGQWVQIYKFLFILRCFIPFDLRICSTFL